jgi:hypothetical protein
MSMPPLRPTVLDWFRSQSNQPIVQFLTWYIILTLEWRFEDLTSVEITELTPQTGPGSSVLYHRWSWSFTFDNGMKSSLLVKGAYGNYHVDSQTTVYQPSGGQTK